ncbi:MAG: hypothetical protein WAM14_24600 [Candidatus Nitrosopolaris sp.]
MARHKFQGWGRLKALAHQTHNGTYDCYCYEKSAIESSKKKQPPKFHYRRSTDEPYTICMRISPHFAKKPNERTSVADEFDGVERI